MGDPTEVFVNSKLEIYREVFRVVKYDDLQEDENPV
jgi:hypothetical protein